MPGNGDWQEVFILVKSYVVGFEGCSKYVMITLIKVTQQYKHVSPFCPLCCWWNYVVGVLGCFNRAVMISGVIRLINI